MRSHKANTNAAFFIDICGTKCIDADVFVDRHIITIVVVMFFRGFWRKNIVYSKPVVRSKIWTYFLY